MEQKCLLVAINGTGWNDEMLAIIVVLDGIYIYHIGPMHLNV
jgi:hypothetical protein